MSDSTRETLTHGTVVHLSAAHRFGTDGLLLADFCRPRRAELAFDLCSGCGIVAEQECAALAAAAREAAAMSKELRSEMAAAARKYYDGNFVMDTLVEELLELMENETKKQE